MDSGLSFEECFNLILVIDDVSDSVGQVFVRLEFGIKSKRLRSNQHSLTPKMEHLQMEHPELNISPPLSII